jgi:DNA-binding IclR family transcriptional regulator
LNDTAQWGAVNSLTRGLEDVETLAAFPDRLTISENLRNLEFPRISTHALLHGLSARLGYVAP